MRRHPALVLAACSLGMSLILMDTTVVNIAAPTIQEDLDAGASTLQWVINAHWENRVGFFEAKPISIPYAISLFPDELYNELDRGGHFAAWEQPQLFAEEMRAGFRSLR